MMILALVIRRIEARGMAWPVVGENYWEAQGQKDVYVLLQPAERGACMPDLLTGMHTPLPLPAARATSDSSRRCVV